MADPYLFPLAIGSALTTTPTLAAITGLSFNVVSGATYRFSVHGKYRPSVTSAVNLVIGMAGTSTATPTILEYTTVIQSSAAAGVVDGTSNTKEFSSAVNATMAGAAAPTSPTTTDLAFVIRGLFVPTVSGTFLVQARNTSTNAANIQAGSIMILDQIA